MTQTNQEFETQVDPQALQELYSRDPEKLSEQDITVIVSDLRKQRAAFATDEQAKAMKPKAKSITKEEAKGMTLGDLGL